MERPPTRPCQPEYVLIPGELLWSGVSHTAVRLWAVVDGHQRDKGEAWTSQHHLAADLGCSPSTVRGAAAELAAAGWLKINHAGAGAGRGKTNTYAVLGSPRETVTSHRLGPEETVTGHRFSPENGDRLRAKTVTGHHRTRDTEQEHALQGRACALAAAVLAVLPDRLAGQLTVSTLEQACAQLPDGWTPETIGLATEGQTWSTARAAGAVIGWIRALGDPPPAAPASKPKASKQCANGYAVAADGSCCPQHAEETSEA